MDNWIETKARLNEIPDLIDVYISNQMRKAPDSVKVREIPSKGTVYEYTFMDNGFECFVLFHKGKKQTGEIIAFNNELNMAFYKRISDMM